MHRAHPNNPLFFLFLLAPDLVEVAEIFRAVNIFTVTAASEELAERSEEVDSAPSPDYTSTKTKSSEDSG